MGIDNQFDNEADDSGLDEGVMNGNDDEALDGEGFDAKKIILFVVLPLFILVGVGAGLYFTGGLDKMLSGGDKKEESAAHGDDEHGGPVMGAYFLEIPNMVVNLNSPDGQPRYLRLSVQLEMGSETDVAAVRSVMPRVIDQFQTYLRELRIKDLRGSKGVYRLQMELLNRVNAAAYPIEVKDVLFQEILIQ